MASKKPKLRVVACQMTSVDDWQVNESQALEILNQVSRPSEVDLFSFPENSLFLRLNEKQSMPSVKDASDPIFDRLSEFCVAHGTTIHLGSVPVAAGSKILNSTVFLYADGRREIAYNKIHLFDVDIQGHRAYRESDSVMAGDKPAIVNVAGWSVGLSICYDLRFSELFNYYTRKEVDLILVPSAFTVPTGRAHWEILIRARAIENQCFIVAAAQEGSHGGKRETYGHSMVVDPWGNILCEAGPGIGAVEAELDHSLIVKARQQIPTLSHRKGPFA